MKHSGPPASPLLEEDFVDESHIQAFAKALHPEQHVSDTHGEASPLLGSSPPSPLASSSRIRKVSALSDFAPVNVKVKRRSRREKALVKRKDWWFVFLRWPLLCIIFAFIAVEFGLYVLIRQLVNTKEWITAWRGKKGALRKKLRAATTYKEWRRAALELDAFLNFNEWKRVDEDTYYDWKLVRRVRLSLRTMREMRNTRGLLDTLETCIKANFAGVESPRLYSETFYGTKDLIESYFSELERSLQYVRDTTELSVDEKRKFFKRANVNLGISALCLSGGASFGYYHFGVVKAFLDAGLLPRVITGTSAGGLVAALVCTRTEEELKALLVPDLADKISPCQESFSVWIKRAWTTGARFDSVQWAQKLAFFTRGSMTFREAYLRTGRILNISVIPADPHSPTKLLNYMTAPNTVIWTAVLASAAVPGILNPVVLMEKREDGCLIPWNWGSKFKDGSLRVDIPIQALNSYFNVTYPVVSQVNPHVHLFFFSPRGSAGKPVAHRKGKAGWRGNFLLSAAEQWLKHELTKNFKIIRDLELLPQLLGQDWSSVFLQRFDGAVTIWPRTRLWDWFRLLSDPDRSELERMMQMGQLVTWPKIHMIENRTRIEKQIFLGRRAIRKIFRSSHGRNRIIQQEQLSQNISRQQLSRAVSPPATDQPLSVDTEAEAAFARESKMYFNQDSDTQILPTGTSQIDALGVDGQSSEACDEQSIETPKVPPQQVKTPSRGNSASSFLSLLHNNSFNNSLSRFLIPSFENTTESGASRASNAGAEQEHVWSSESSSETIDERRMSQFSLIPSLSRRDSQTVDSNSDEDD